jgi:hypothetical protein
MTKQERTARFLAGALFLALFFLWGVGYNCFPIFLPSILKQFHLSRLQVGLVPGVQAITAGVFGLLVGPRDFTSSRRFRPTGGGLFGDSSEVSPEIRTRWRSGMNSNWQFRNLNSQTTAGCFVRRHPDETPC